MKKIYPLLPLILLMIIIGCGGEKTAMENIVFDHCQRRPQSEAADLYKLAYQAAMGIGHFIDDEEKARNYLEWELGVADSAENAPLIEALSPDGKMVRVNLRAYKASGGEVEPLFEAMMETLENFQPSREKLELYWQYIIAAAEKRMIFYDKEELEAYFEEMRGKDFPAVHHSEIYRERYHPAYRVVMREYLPESILR